MELSTAGGVLLPELAPGRAEASLRLQQWFRKGGNRHSQSWSSWFSLLRVLWFVCWVRRDLEICPDVCVHLCVCMCVCMCVCVCVCVCVCMMGEDGKAE